MIRYLILSFFRTIGSLNGSFRFRYIAAAFAAAAVTQFVFGLNVIIWIVASVVAFQIRWLAHPDTLTKFSKYAVFFLLVATVIFMFIPAGSIIALALASLAVPIIWQRVVFNAIVDSHGQKTDFLITTLNILHVGVVFFYLGFLFKTLLWG